MAKAENCPKRCKHETFHYCSDAGTHCGKHCICACQACVMERQNPGPADPETGGRILSGAVVREIEGQLVLEDPVALAVIHAVGKHNCRGILELNADRIEHFKRRMVERDLSPSEAVIVFLNANDVHGGPLADALMPGFNWQEIRDCGEVPFARGLAMREGIQEALATFDKEAAEKLRGMADTAVVVVDHGVAEVFEV